MSRTSAPDFEEGTLNAYVIQGNEIKGGDRFGYRVIAIADEYSNTWRCYKGPTTWDDQKIADYGDPVPDEVARKLFPTLAAVRTLVS